MYTVIVSFSDAINKGVYHVGDTYPKPGITPTKDRVDYLMGNQNRFGRPVIKKASSKKEEK